MTVTQPTRVPATRRPVETSPRTTPGLNPTGADVRGGAKLYGAFSVETFCNAGPLGLTHDDAEGWLAYVSQFNAPNFHYRDAGVKIWAYYETYDNWQDTYGLDAVRSCYHSGHGAMDANGVFYVPMGAAWAGNDCTATSSNMRLGNEGLRYVFWSTCESLRVLDGHSPVRTWSAANLGLRMIFGFETVSWDDARYGSGFWHHWKQGKSLSTAWLDASWDIATDQAPSVSANGATAEEAQHRLFNERYLAAEPASTAWWWWRWYDVRGSAAREPSRHVPAEPRGLVLAPITSRSLSSVAQRFDVDASAAEHLPGSTAMSAGNRVVHLGDDGTVSATLAEPNLANRTALPRAAAASMAADAVRAFGLDEHGPLVIDRIVAMQEAGATQAGDGQAEGPFTTGTIVQLRQAVEGMTVITPGAGTVRVTLDNDGTVVHVQSSTREVEGFFDQPRTTPREPAPPGGAGGDDTSMSGDPADVDARLADAFGRRLRAIVAAGAAPVGYSTVPGTTEVGYDLRAHSAVLVAQRAVEVDFGRGLRKRYWVSAPIFG